MRLLRAHPDAGPIAPTTNGLLAALPREDLEVLRPQMRLVDMPIAHALSQPGEPLAHTYFPVEGMVALLYVSPAGDSTELAVVGREGLVGVSLVMGNGITPNLALAQSACRAWRVPSRSLQARFDRGGRMQQVFLRFVQALIAQISLTAVCNLHHNVEQQLCRWLLLSLDRLAGNDLQVTHELIASLLGVRRQGVTEAARHLEKLRIIRQTRGHITVLDRPRLEQECCECYAVVRREYDRLLGPGRPDGAS